MSLQKQIFGEHVKFYCASCNQPRPYANHRSGIPLGWTWHLQEQVFTCPNCNGVTVNEEKGTATVKY